MNIPQDKIKVLHLARWYPNRYDPMPGLFIQRHVEAANRFVRAGVVYTHVAENQQIEGFESEISLVNEVPTARVFYSNPKYNIPLLSPIIKAFRFYKANAIGIKQISDELEGFHLIHVHVLTRLGLIALWYKWFRGKPFVVTEHWSRYLNLTGDFRGFFRKMATRLVVKNAAVVTTVTQNLADAMQRHGLTNSNYKVMANVVADDFLYHPVNKHNSGRHKATFVHVSCFEDKSKNISGLLRAIKSLSLERTDFKFKLIGDGMDFESLKKYAREIGLGTVVLEFTGLLEGKQLVAEMASADMMVVFSHYENLPVVINESFALGVPVVATRVGGIPELVNDSNGRLINAGDEKALEKCLRDFLDRKLKFNPNEIRNRSKKSFASESIGRELFSIYQSLVPVLEDGENKD